MTKEKSKKKKGSYAKFTAAERKAMKEIHFSTQKIEEPKENRPKPKPIGTGKRNKRKEKQTSRLEKLRNMNFIHLKEEYTFNEDNNQVPVKYNIIEPDLDLMFQQSNINKRRF